MKFDSKDYDDDTAYRPEFSDQLLMPWLLHLGIVKSPEDLARTSYDERQAWLDLCDKYLSQVDNDSKNDTQEQFATRIEQLKSETRKVGCGPNDAYAMNFLDELADLAKVPKLDPALRTKYVKILEQTIKQRETSVSVMDIYEEPGSSILADFVDAHSMQLGMITPEYYLTKYPTSPRAELAQFRILKTDVHAEELVPEACKQAFADYEKAYPNGELKRGELWLRGQFEERQSHWGAAADIYVKLIEQKEAPELHLDAAAHLSYIFELLNFDTKRQDVLADLKQFPAVRKALRRYVQDNEMPYLTGFVLEQVPE